MPRNFHFHAGPSVAAKPFGRIMKLLGRNFSDAQDAYIKFYQNDDGTAQDIGWIYNERPNIGFLAAAAWRQSGWIALEEYVTEKSRPGGKSKGRADLLIGAKIGWKTYSVAVEAKQRFCRTAKLVKANLNPRLSTSGIAMAMRDAEASISGSEVDYRCGLVFICPTILWHRNLDRSFDEISDAFWDACYGLGRRRWAAFSHVPDKIEQFWIDAADGRKVLCPAIGVLAIAT